MLCVRVIASSSEHGTKRFYTVYIDVCDIAKQDAYIHRISTNT